MSTPYENRKDWRINIAKPLSIFFPTIKKDKSHMADQKNEGYHLGWRERNTPLPDND